jgi:hypothetical protein
MHTIDPSPCHLLKKHELNLHLLELWTQIWKVPCPDQTVCLILNRFCVLRTWSLRKGIWLVTIAIRFIYRNKSRLANTKFQSPGTICYGLKKITRKPKASCTFPPNLHIVILRWTLSEWSLINFWMTPHWVLNVLDDSIFRFDFVTWYSLVLCRDKLQCSYTLTGTTTKSRRNPQAGAGVGVSSSHFSRGVDGRMMSHCTVIWMNTEYWNVQNVVSCPLHLIILILCIFALRKDLDHLLSF